MDTVNLAAALGADSTQRVWRKSKSNSLVNLVKFAVGDPGSGLVNKQICLGSQLPQSLSKQLGLQRK